MARRRRHIEWVYLPAAAVLMLDVWKTDGAAWALLAGSIGLALGLGGLLRYNYLLSEAEQQSFDERMQRLQDHPIPVILVMFAGLLIFATVLWLVDGRP